MQIRFLICLSLFTLVGCRSDLIKDRPISFSEWRVQETLRYVNAHYDRTIDSLEMLPVMVVVHYTAMDSLETSFQYMNKEAMESGRKLLQSAGAANIAVQFLVAKNGDIYRLMPENHIGRHVIGMNRHAIGIENVGADEKALTHEQIAANAYIIRQLVKKFPIRYLIAHSEYRNFESTPLWEERDAKYRTEKIDPGASFMQPLRAQLADLQLQATYDGGEIPVRINNVLKNYAKKNLFHGNALIIKNGALVYRASITETNSKSPALSLESALYLASAAKPITALAVALLVERGKIKYDTPVAPYFPPLKRLLRGVTVRHLLAHTSGLEDYYALATATPGFTNADALAALEKQRAPLSRPGRKFHYANSNYVLLAEIIARVAGQPFTKFVAENIFLKTQMAQSFFRIDQHEQAESAIAATDKTGNIFRYPFDTVGAGGLYTTVDDLARFDRALWQNQLLGKNSLQVMVHPTALVEKKHTPYALGWYADDKRKVIYHDGNFRGYHTMNWLQLPTQSAIILMVNTSTDKIKEITFEIDRILNGMQAQRIE